MKQQNLVCHPGIGKATKQNKAELLQNLTDVFDVVTVQTQSQNMAEHCANFHQMLTLLLCFEHIQLKHFFLQARQCHKSQVGQQIMIC